MTDIQNLQKDLNSTIDALTETAKRLKSSAREAVNKKADYENKKNGYLIQLAAEDSESGNKRTVSLQQAMYRKMFENERRASLLADAEYESDRDLFRGIMAKLNALQTMARLTESEMKMA